MKITETTYRPSVAQLRRKGTQSTGSTSFSDVFSAVDAGETGETEAPQQAAALTGLNPLLSLQEVDDREARRSKAVHRAQDQLQALERLRQALLMGTLTPQTLRDLESSLARKREQIDDPQLLEILDEVELRVAVEMAKIEVAQGYFA